MRLPKAMKFEEDKNQLGSKLGSVYVRGVKHSQRIVKSSVEAQAVFDATHSLVMSTGCRLTPEKKRAWVVCRCPLFDQMLSHKCWDPARTANI